MKAKQASFYRITDEYNIQTILEDTHILTKELQTAVAEMQSVGISDYMLDEEFNSDMMKCLKGDIINSCPMQDIISNYNYLYKWELIYFLNKLGGILSTDLSYTDYFECVRNELLDTIPNNIPLTIDDAITQNNLVGGDNKFMIGEQGLLYKRDDKYDNFTFYNFQGFKNYNTGNYISSFEDFLQHISEDEDLKVTIKDSSISLNDMGTIWKSDDKLKLVFI